MYFLIQQINRFIDWPSAHRSRTTSCRCKIFEINILSDTEDCFNVVFFRISKTQFDKRREKMKHKRQLGVEQDNKKDEEEDEDDDEKEAQKLYAEYMAEVVSALVFNANPKADLTAVIAAVEQVAIKAIKFDTAIYAVSNSIRVVSCL